jgi:hypothetical protein
LLQKAIADEIAAIGAVIQLPATIIADDLAVITGAVGGTSSAALGNAVTQSDAATAAATPADAASGLLAIAQLPFQNYFTIASTLGSLAAFVPPVNAATGAFFQGQWDKIPLCWRKPSMTSSPPSTTCSGCLRRSSRPTSRSLPVPSAAAWALPP